MPILCLYVGLSETSFLLVNSAEDVKYYSVPYSYSKNSSSSDFNQFYKDITGKLKIPMENVELLVTGFLEPPKFDANIKFSLSLCEIIDQNHIFANYFSVIYKGNVYSQFDLNNLNLNEKVDRNSDPQNINLYSNLSEYSFIKPSEGAETALLDLLIRNRSIDILKSVNNIVICGDRFNLNRFLWPQDYILAFDLIKSTGFFNFKIDYKNCTPLIQLLRKYSFDTYHSIEVDSFVSGSILKSPGKTECLLNYETEKPKIIEVEEGGIFIVPIDQNGDVNVVVKNEFMNSFEFEVPESDIGLVIDTRDSNKTYSPARIKDWENRVLEGLRKF
ncbi:hypothetical protein A3H26_03990 [candidate division WWE3 bacterium RIFCSPLOWO2_12_FULL_36_10]|uniref:Uncharacterized protein n=1 Tax=candidate division WWE3 bacterium RIFCSPLOWO2_12_FULL_36_10 TaxID=1802630 RepID=A0A1F4VK42_UNCKA|nr:MAG: hypothetical protein A3H26_03990 [candidate division WWE3 bacterium RIFCSPLOWO2_12_FULL_36_10]